MTVFLTVLGSVLILVGLAGVVLPVLPGGPLMFVGLLLVAWADGFTRIGSTGLVAMGALAVLMVVVDYAASALGARRYGSSAWGALGAVVGALAGLPFGIPGLILGPLVGALLLEYLKDPDLVKAARVGFGSFLGFVIGTAVKYALAGLMLGLGVLLYFF